MKEERHSKVPLGGGFYSCECGERTGVSLITIDDHIAVDRLASRVALLEEALERLEWSVIDEDDDGEELHSCPACGAAKEEGRHYPLCFLAAALAHGRGTEV